MRWRCLGWMTMNRRPKSRGFSLIEVMIVISIIAVVAAIAIPGLHQSMRKQRVRTETRLLMSALREARGIALSRTSVPGLQCIGAGNGGSGGGGGTAYDCLPKTIGLRLTSPTSYEIVAQVPGNEVILQIVDLREQHPDTEVSIESPPPTTIVRFTGQGTLASAAPPFVIRDLSTDEVHTINVTLAGSVSIE